MQPVEDACQVLQNYQKWQPKAKINNTMCSIFLLKFHKWLPNVLTIKSNIYMNFSKSLKVLSLMTLSFPYSTSSFLFFMFVFHPLTRIPHSHTLYFYSLYIPSTWMIILQSCPFYCLLFLILQILLICLILQNSIFILYL